MEIPDKPRSICVSQRLLQFVIVELPTRRDLENLLAFLAACAILSLQIGVLVYCRAGRPRILRLRFAP